MLVVMQQGATEEQVQNVIDRLVDLGFDVHRSTGVMHTVLGGVGGKTDFDLAMFEVMDGVKEAHRIVSPYKLASRSFRPAGTTIRIRDLTIGGEQVVVIAGTPAADQIDRCAAIVAEAGAHILHALGDEKSLAEARAAADRHGLFVLAEAAEVASVAQVSEHADILQVAARNMQNFALLRELGKRPRPVLLERGLAATIEELLLAAELVLQGGNYNVILCERGIRTFETYTAATMDISAIPIVKKLSHLPVVADPSLATGRRDKVPAMARAAVAAGADGLVIEVHPDPDHASVDGAQSLRPDQFSELMGQLRMIAAAVGRTL
ncbi:MAG TPA: 3-deoxy-7-phosphoheptulonate synthase [Candidatus Acidoferrales bacterium]|nr:3-deoxy-7-phosphoheptulonate synthase [Candidatus Acidoferrales bacterium]